MFKTLWLLFVIVVITAIVIAIFGPLFKWGLKVIKDLKHKKEEEG